MNAKVLGGYCFKSKKGTDLVCLSVSIDNVSGFGIRTENYMCMKSDLSCKPEELINKTIRCDRDDKFLSNIEVK